MKKYILVLYTVVFAFCLTACGNEPAQMTSVPAVSSTAVQTTDVPPAETTKVPGTSTAATTEAPETSVAENKPATRFEAIIAGMGTMMNEEETAKWNEFVKPLIVGHFLTQDYNSPKELDFWWVFCDGAVIPDETNDYIATDKLTLSEEELKLLESRFDRWKKRQPYQDTMRIRRKEMNDVLLQYTGLTLEDTYQIGLADSFDYLPEYDAYYLLITESFPNRFRIMEGAVMEADGSVWLHWVVENGTTMRAEDEGSVHLKKDGDVWHFTENQIWK